MASYTFNIPAQKFLSTLPARGATKWANAALLVTIISIHAPREGSDVRDHRQRAEHPISIHAPREGSDSKDGVCPLLHQYFYPRSPRGERPSAHGVALFCGISIHAPREGSDRHTASRADSVGISIHAPREGSDWKTGKVF